MAGLSRQPALPLAGLVLATAGFLISAESPALQIGLVVSAALELAALWQARSRPAFAALMAGGFLWAVKRQSGTRRWLMGLGASLFAAGLLRGAGLRRGTILLRLWLAQPAGAWELAAMALIAAAFAAWFLTAAPSLTAEGPALAALGILAGAAFSPGLRAVDAGAAAAALGLALWLSKRAPGRLTRSQ